MSGTINTSKSSDLITFKILIDGEEIPQTVQVLNIVVTKEVNRISLARIVIIDGDASEETFKVSSEALFVPGKKIEISAGYHMDDSLIFKGIVIKHSIKIRSNSTFLTIECKDEAVKMTIGRKSAYFYDSKDSDIFDQLIGEYGLESEIEDTAYEHKELVQFNSSDWDFIVSRAQANGKLCFVDDGKILIKEPGLSSEAVERLLSEVRYSILMVK